MKMKKFFCGVAVLSLLVFAACSSTEVATPATQDESPASGEKPSENKAKSPDVEGLWINVATWPEKFDGEELKKGDAGEVSYWRNLNSLMFLTVNRWTSSGSANADTVKETVAKKLNIDAASIKISQDEKLSAKYTYPVWRLEFSSGANEDSNERWGLFLGTDSWDFYLDVTADADFVGGYQDEEFDPKLVDNWFSNLELVD